MNRRDRSALFSLSLSLSRHRNSLPFCFPVKRFLFAYNKTPPSSFTSSFRNRAGPGFFPFFCILDPQTSSRRNSFGPGSMIPQFLSLSFLLFMFFSYFFVYIDSSIRNKSTIEKFEDRGVRRSMEFRWIDFSSLFFFIYRSILTFETDRRSRNSRIEKKRIGWINFSSLFFIYIDRF